MKKGDIVLIESGSYCYKQYFEGIIIDETKTIFKIKYKDEDEVYRFNKNTLKLVSASKENRTYISEFNKDFYDNYLKEQEEYHKKWDLIAYLEDEKKFALRNLNSSQLEKIKNIINN